MTAPRRLSRIPVRHARRTAAPLRNTGNASRRSPRVVAAAGPAAVRRRFGDTGRGGGDRADPLAAGDDADTRWDFPLGDYARTTALRDPPDAGAAMTAPRRLSRIPARRSRRVAAPLRNTGNTSRRRPPVAAAAGLAAERLRLGDTAGEGKTARIYLAAGDDGDIRWDFPLGGFPVERPHLATLRGPALR